MAGLTRDIAKLINLVRDNGIQHAIGIGLLAVRARLMRRADTAWESSMGLVFDESNVSLNSLCIDSPNKGHGFSYVPCTGVAVRSLLNNIDDDFTRFGFIDFGSGEGRSLVVASTYHFDQVIGVEFAAELHQTACRNLEKLNPQAAQSGKLMSVHMDAAQFEIPRRDCVLYFYNPFGEEVFQQVLNNIERVHREFGVKFYIIFHQTKSHLEVDDTANADILRAASFLKPRVVRFPTWWTRFLLGSQDHYIFETEGNTANVSDRDRDSQCDRPGVVSQSLDAAAV